MIRYETYRNIHTTAHGDKYERHAKAYRCGMQHAYSVGFDATYTDYALTCSGIRTALFDIDNPPRQIYVKRNAFVRERFASHADEANYFDRLWR